MVFSETFRNYYYLLLWKYALFGIVAYIATSFLKSFVMTYVSWIVGLLIAISIVVLQEWNMKLLGEAVKPETWQDRLASTVINSLPGVKFTHMLLLPIYKMKYKTK